MPQPFFQPDCVIIGAPKCGTTALADILGSHPEVCVSRIKEPHYFSRQPGDLENLKMGSGPKANGSFDRGNAWYRSLFECDREPEEMVTLEATTDYTAREDTPSIMAEHCRPGLKLLMMVRDPVSRVHSHFLHEDRLGLDTPSLSAMLRDGHPRLEYFLNCTRYEHHLERFSRALPASPILVLAMEALRAQPQAMLQQVSDFLGLDMEGVQWDTARERNIQFAPRARIISRWTTRLRFNPYKRHLPDAIRRRLFRAFTVVQRMNAKPVGSRRLAQQDRESLSRLLTRETEFHARVMESGGFKMMGG